VTKQRPEPNTSYAIPPTAEHRAASLHEAAKGLAQAWHIPEYRAMELLDDPGEYLAEWRSRRRLTLADAARDLAARTASPQ
jgi:hypothetical protein